MASGASPSLDSDGIEDIVHGNFEQSEVSSLSVGLGRVLGGCLRIAPEAQF